METNACADRLTCNDATFWWWWCLGRSFSKGLTKESRHYQWREWELVRSTISACDWGAKKEPPMNPGQPSLFLCKQCSRRCWSNWKKQEERVGVFTRFRQLNASHITWCCWCWNLAQVVAEQGTRSGEHSGFIFVTSRRIGRFRCCHLR